MHLPTKEKDTKMANIIGMIPARGGSKRLPGKNIKPFLGKPLIAWTIEQAKSSSLLNKVVVSTDDNAIADTAKRFGAEVPFLRPKELAMDSSPTIDAVLHMLDWFGKKGERFDFLALLEPTSPLRTNSDIDNAIKLFMANTNRADALVSVGEVHLEKPNILKRIDKEYVAPLLENGGIKSQPQTKAYFPYGVIYISKVESLRKNRTFYPERTIPYLIERWQNYEIDDIFDHLCCEAIQQHRLNSNRT